LVAEKLASVGKLAASVAHEIRNPLTAMKMWLFSIQEAVQGNADLGRRLGIISEEITRLESIVRNFLEFSRPMTLHCRPQDIGAVIDQTLEFLGPRFQAEKINITCKPRSALPPVMADAAQLKQVLLNLLGNAADAIAGGGEVRITSNAEKDADGRPMVVVRIGDTGPGMPRDIQCRIFEPFFTTKDKGSGLGLCIAAQVMVRHGGRLVLESSTEMGTTFAVWMPIAPEEANGQDSRSG
jgi:signal transduction histidine kinase